MDGLRVELSSEMLIRHLVTTGHPLSHVAVILTLHH